GAGKPRRTVRVVETETLVDFRVGPELRALPQLDTGGKRQVEGFLRLRAAAQAVRPFIGRAERRIGLLHVSGLPMYGKDIDGRHETRWRVGGRAKGIIESIVEAEAKLLQRQIRNRPLPQRRKSHALV